MGTILNRPNLEFPKASRDIPGGYSNSRVADVVKMATRKGLEPSTSGVTGRRSNQLNYRAIFISEYHKQIALYYAVAGAEGIEPSARGFGDRCSTC